MGIDFFFAFYCFWFGSILGSFSNVCIYRMPRKESIVLPPSHCPACDKYIRWYDNVPLLSWVLLRGKCRHCGAPISIRYPLVELTSGIIYLTIYLYWGISPYFFLYSLLCSTFLVVAVIDYDHKIIPDAITLSGILAGLLSSLVVRQITLLNSISGLLLGGGIFFIIAVVSRGGMGGGDIKLMAMIGAFLGWKAIFFTTFIGSLTGSSVGLFLMALGKKGRKDQIPFGPFLVLGATIYIFWGEHIIQWYFMIARGNG